MATSDEIQRLQQERALYRELLDLDRADSLGPFLEEALPLVVKIAGAMQGYLELRDPTLHGDDPVWSAVPEADDARIEEFRRHISQGIIAEALATGHTIETASAILDERFRDNDSVQTGRIQAVLCAPIGTAPPLGVVYLQGRYEPGPFTKPDVDRVELLARHIAPLADRLLLRRRNELTRDATAEVRASLPLDGFVGRSEAIARTLRQVALLAPLDVDLLVRGAAGAGKRTLVRILHANGPRSLGPLVSIHCVADGVDHVEDRLFGTAGGADGALAQAAGGTLHLHQIEALPPSAQARLAELLDPVTVRRARRRFRLIASTDSDLASEVEAGRFRRDLLQHLEVLTLWVPSLQERRDDIAPLASALCAESLNAHGIERALGFSVRALYALEAAEWPGNVRQLAERVEAGVARAHAEGVHQIEHRHLFPDGSDVKPEIELTFQEATRDFQRRFLLRVLEDVEWNVSEAARRLEIARSHVYNLIKAFDLRRGVD